MVMVQFAKVRKQAVTELWRGSQAYANYMWMVRLGFGKNYPGSCWDDRWW